MTTAETVVAQSYDNGGMGYYARLSDRYLRSIGGQLVASSNDGESIMSFSPTDTWEFPDGSRAIIGYSMAEAEIAAPHSNGGFMELNEIKALYPEAPRYRDEVGRFVGRNGATYRAWWNGQAQRIDSDCHERQYGEESAEIFHWRE